MLKITMQRRDNQDKKYNDERKKQKTKKQTVFSMYKTPHIKLNIEQEKPYCNLG